MILFKPRLDVDFEKITAENFGRCIFAETILDGTKIVLVNIYALNDATQQVKKGGRPIDGKKTSLNEL